MKVGYKYLAKGKLKEAWGKELPHYAFELALAMGMALRICQLEFSISYLDLVCIFEPNYHAAEPRNFKRNRYRKNAVR